MNSRIKTILVLLAFTDATPEIIRVTRELARALNAKIYLVHIEDPESDYSGNEARPDVSREAIAGEMHGKHRKVRIVAKGLAKSGIEATGLLVKGRPVKKALEELDRLKPDLVIVGSHGRGRLYHLMPGHVGAVVAARARCPVLIVPAPRKA